MEMSLKQRRERRRGTLHPGPRRRHKRIRTSTTTRPGFRIPEDTINYRHDPLEKAEEPGL